MSQPEQFEVLILGSGQGGKVTGLAYGAIGATDCRRGAPVDWGSCPNIACLPSKNEIWSARVAHLVHHAAQFGTANLRFIASAYNVNNLGNCSIALD
jgi:pyruvate/2-oxoglutarate dehydrogenase complex dihydrolipoamide dehydrogenase (E3) component